MHEDLFAAYESAAQDTAPAPPQFSVEHFTGHAILSYLPTNFTEASKTPTLEKGGTKSNGFERMLECRRALDSLDRRGWKRSFFQRKFHEKFLCATARAFWKVDPPGQFAKDYQKILEVNGWDEISQEILISTPRRFGKTISVSMFAACLIYSAAGAEVSIYSTCKRISQKLLRNVAKFLDLIYQEEGSTRHRVINCNSEELVIQGPEGPEDRRVVNSYPSKVRISPRKIAPAGLYGLFNKIKNWPSSPQSHAGRPASPYTK
jgi:hypothetical protein